MSKTFDLPDTIPVFPLPGALLLPRSHLPLHLFEPRYLQMLDDVLKTEHRLIGMVQPYGKDHRLHSIVCAGRVTAFSESDDWLYINTISWLSRFRIPNEFHGFSPYHRCKVSSLVFERYFGLAVVD